MVVSVLSRQGPRWHNDGAPKDGRVPAWVMGKNQGLGLSLGWKITAHLGCFEWRWLLVYLAIMKARKGVAVFLY
jgi:hypothetical protein